MKFVLSLLVSGLLIACMAGSAIASTPPTVVDKENLMPVDEVTVSPGSMSSVVLKVNDLPSDLYDFTLSVEGTGISAKIVQDSVFNGGTATSGHPVTQTNMWLPRSGTHTINIYRQAGTNSVGTVTVSLKRTSG